MYKPSSDLWTAPPQTFDPMPLLQPLTLSRPSLHIRTPPLHSLSTSLSLLEGLCSGHSPCLKRLSIFNLDHYIANAFFNISVQISQLQEAFFWPPSPRSKVSFFFFPWVYGDFSLFSNLKRLRAVIERIQKKGCKARTVLHIHCFGHGRPFF